ncbi:MAG: hypothetical protein MUP76_09815 [Acidimicrobiia bacterium]|nr:hypothetical protein [Acidimicrobiia bacterium]
MRPEIVTLESDETCPWGGCDNRTDAAIFDPHRGEHIDGCRFHITAYRRWMMSKARHPST